MKLISNMIYSVVFQLLTIFVPIITMPYVSRILGVSGIGINAYTNSFATYFVLLGGLGIALYGNREVAYSQGNKVARSKVFFELVFIKFISIGLMIAAYLIFVGFQTKWQIFFLIQGVALLTAALDISWFFMGLENFRIIVVRNSIIQLLILVAIFTLVKSPKDLSLYISLTVVSALLGNLSVWPFLRREVVRVPFKELEFQKHLKPLFLLLLPQIITQVYLSLNKSLLGAISGIDSVGYFYNSDNLTRVGFLAISSLATAFLPRLSALRAKKAYEEMNRLMRQLLNLSNFLSLLVIFGIMGVSNTFATYFFGNQYQPVGLLMAVQSIMIIFVSWAYIIGNQYLLATDRIKDLTTSYVIALMVNVSVNLLLIPKLAAMGAVIASISTEAAATLYQIWVVRKIFKLSDILQDCWKYFIAGIFELAVLFFMNLQMEPKMINYVLQAFVACLVYGIVLFFLRARILGQFKIVLISFASKK